ncbi:MAG: hypothetical protein LBP96_01795 [Bacteroidales bacterium]|jgi:hypothetical protein|nr:hypothetical protein [Bacteroidales bacterium]
MKHTTTSFPDVHIGSLIRKQLKDEGRTLTWLSKQVHCDSSNLCKLLTHDSIHTDTLFRISAALRTDYFKCFSKHLLEYRAQEGGGGWAGYAEG